VDSQKNPSTEDVPSNNFCGAGPNTKKDTYAGEATERAA
jgi:hypothetical protein